MQNIPSVSVVIPCYNEAKRLPLDEYIQFFSEKKPGLTCLFVDDGSTDNTFQLINELTGKFPESVSCLKLSKNSGKAEAVRTGILHVLKDNPDYVAYWDADLSTSLNEIELFNDFLRSHEQAILLMGSRVKLHGSTVVIRNEFRHYVGRIVATLISSLLKLAVYDTQCGAKFIKASDASYLFKDPFISRWLFDVEIIFRILEKNGYTGITKQLFEIPLNKWIEKGDSNVSWAYIFKLPIDLTRLWLRYSQVRSS